MKPEVIILIITNIVVPIAVAIITAFAQSKKYIKEIQMLNAEHENKLKEIQSEYEHKIEILELQHKHQQELETQKTGNTIYEMLADKVSDEIMNQPATKKLINRKTTRSFLNKKR